MKKKFTRSRWLTAMIMLMATMVMPSTAWAQTMYTVFDTETGTLTFKYDDSKPESTDAQKVYDVPTTSSTMPDWINHHAPIKTVVFDASFADARPTTCSHWFGGCSELKDIQGIGYLNTCEVTDMRSMFYYCYALTSLDLSSFNTAKVTNMRDLFKNCYELHTIYVSDLFNTANVKQSGNMFYGCSKICGVVIFDSNNMDKTYANYTNGYFTYAIKTAENLKSFAEYVNAGKKGIAGALLNDITLAADFIFTPVGSNGYTGTFDGLGHTISGLSINGGDNVGLFAKSSGTIKNVGIVSATVKGSNAGGICGNNTGTISNCFYQGTLEGTTNAGGICGSNGTNGRATNCYAYSTDDNKFGICGTNSGTISNCYYFANEASNDGGMTSEQFASGEVCYLMNNGITNGTQAWYQNINNGATDAYPLLDSSHGTVFASLPCMIHFSNTDNLPAENHANEYTVSDKDNSISAKCTKCGIDWGAVTLTAASTTYDGQSHAASVDGTIGGATMTVTYQTQDGSDLGTSAPKNAGTYKAILTCRDNEVNYSVSMDYTIEKAENAPNRPNEFTGCIGAKLSTVSLKDNEGWSWDDPELTLPENVENITVKASYSGDDKDNYENITSVDVTINLTPYHDYTNGFCDYCGGYMPARIVSNEHHPELIGTHEGYYAIENAGQLYWFAALVNGTLTDGTAQNLSANAVLVNDITINTGVLKADGTLADDTSGFRVWTPIFGNSYPNNYAGTFDGQSHTVSGLYFNDSSANSVGLFGYIGTSGKISNVGVVDSYICGSNRVGGVCGAKYGTMENCYSASTVSGATAVGGVCGNNYNGNLLNCYHTGAVSGTGWYIGGVCGIVNKGGTIQNCYSTGTVSGSDSSVGGLCGTNFATISNCYFDSSKCNKNTVGINQNTVEKTEGKTTEQFASGEVAYLLNSGVSDGTQKWYQTIGTDASPVLDNTHGTVYCNLTYSGCAGNPGEPVSSAYENTEKEDVYADHDYENNGFCTICSGYEPAELIDGVYQIKNAGQLYWFAGLVNGTLDGEANNTSANAVLTDNITVNTGGIAYCDGVKGDGWIDWTPIGKGILDPNTLTGYSGTFDGKNHTISGLYINGNTLYAGLFGYSSGTIQNVGVVNSYFNGTNVGGVCGVNQNGTIQNCYNNSTVKGTQIIGGVCGRNINNQSKILNCYNVGTVGQATNAGGVCGINQGGSIANCYYLSGTATGGINGADAAGSAEGKSLTQFVSGEVAWLLAQGCTVGDTFYDGSVWGQQLGVNDYPVLANNKTVYRGYKDCLYITYSNDQEELSENPVHHYDNGFCKHCDGYESATLNASSEYEIGNAGQLYWFAGLVNGTLTDGTSQNTTAKGVLTDHIDLARISNWTPIGNQSNKFGGTFDGKNFKVQHLSITQQGSNSGLFGYASGATMQNICIDGNITLNTTSYTEGYGSIAGCMEKSTISNCHSSVNFTINTEMDASVNCIGHIGGIVGKMYETSSTESYVSGCSYSGTINLGNKKVNVAAGIAGYAIYSNVPITNCSFTGTIHSKCEDALIMGGIFGYTRSSGNVKVTNCLQAGTLEKTGNSSLTGILIGQINTGYGANAVTNNYYTSSTFNVIGSTTGTPTTTPATQCSTEQLQSGEICYLLNGSSSDGGWGQQIGTDSYPVPGSNHKVYEVNLLCGGVKDLGKTYANTNEDVTVEHILPETATLDPEKKIYHRVCQREGCGETIYFADAAGTVEATPNAGATAFTVPSYTLTDATAYGNLSEFTATEFTYNRTFSNDGWQAVYVPFDVDCTQLPDDLEMAVINNFHEYEQEDGTYNVVLEVKRKKFGTIPSLTPCLIRMKSAPMEPEVKSLNFSNAVFAAAADMYIDCFSVTRYYKFTGSLAGLAAGSLKDGEDFVLNLGKLNKANEKTSLKAQRWYLTATDRAGSGASFAMPRSISIHVAGESDVTGMEDIYVITEGAASAREGIFDLQGRRLSKEPTHGIYIKNGTKYVKK